MLNKNVTFTYFHIYDHLVALANVTAYDD